MTPRNYIVKQLEYVPSSEVNQLFLVLQAKVVICIFNGFWPMFEDLPQCMTWSKNCGIYVCLKGFFIVWFNSQEDIEKVLKEKPRFYGRARLFITPWFPKFNSTIMVVKKVLVLGKVSKPPSSLLAS